uniref:Potassium channel subfamily U member 1 n=1 Tax=Monodelphis domestica TaxID=13616 RepID=A0A5F8GWM2_MONDO
MIPNQYLFLEFLPCNHGITKAPESHVFTFSVKFHILKKEYKMACPIEVQKAFFLSSIATFLVGLVILYIGRQVRILSRKYDFFRWPPPSNRLKFNRSKMYKFHTIFHERIDMLISGQTFVGRLLMILVFLLSIASLVIYFISSSNPASNCSSTDTNILLVDLAFNVFFAFYFGLRFLASGDKIKFWLELNSVVDILTIPPTFISFYLHINWLGLRFLRSFKLLELPIVLQYLRIIKSGSSAKFYKIVSLISCTWLTAAGFLHLVENTGDPWLKGRNSHILSYFDAFYLVMATTSTVGFGDVVARTTLGRAFIMFFILLSLILFANYVPKLVETLTGGQKYAASYKVIRGRKFIVVCGDISVDTVTSFLRNFLGHRSRENNNEIIFLGESLPSPELEIIFKLYLAYAHFYHGSALKREDLRRVAVESSEACLILANPSCPDSHMEDTANIMRVLSIKNYYPKTRVIIQIIQPQNKDYLLKIPHWNRTSGDNIICFAELKLGLIAQGCLVPGLATFLISLFMEQTGKAIPKHPWQELLVDGLSNKIFTHFLSCDFEGMSFREVSRLCFVKLRLMLIAIEYKTKENGFRSLMLNPPEMIKVNRNTIGYFIAKSLHEVKRAFLYCVNCHSDVNSPEIIGHCACRSKKEQKSHSSISPGNMRHFHNKRTNEINIFDSTKILSKQTALTPDFIMRDTIAFDRDMKNDLFDSSGLFHWCTPILLENAILKQGDNTKTGLQNHIIACVFGDAHSPLLGLRNFVMPLRSSNYTFKELKDIVFIGSLDYLKREWQFLKNFPKLYLFPGSAHSQGDLKSVNIEKCSMCVILSSPSDLSNNQRTVDGEAILATLNIGTLRLETNKTLNTNLLEKCSRLSSYSSPFQGNFRRIPILIELKNASNIKFIDQLCGMNPDLPEANLYFSTSFSTGAVFSCDFLESLFATAFYNYHVLELLQMLVTGGVSYEMEPYVGNENAAFSESCFSVLITRGRCKLGLLSLNQTMLLDLPARDTFGEVFCASLDNFGILCLGLYRLIDDESRNPLHKRFVIARPDNDFKLQPTDFLFCAIPFNVANYNQPVADFHNLKTVTLTPNLSKQESPKHRLTSDSPPSLLKLVEKPSAPIHSFSPRHTSTVSGGIRIQNFRDIKRVEVKKEGIGGGEMGDGGSKKSFTRGIGLETKRESDDEETQVQVASSYNKPSIFRISMLGKTLFP